MQTITIWLLIAVSAASYNRGTVTVVAEFKSPAACDEVAKRVESLGAVDVGCIKATVVNR